MVEKQSASVLSSQVQYLRGIGPKKAYALSQVGVETVEDLIYYLPRKYLDRSSFTPISQLKINATAGKGATLFLNIKNWQFYSALPDRHTANP